MKLSKTIIILFLLTYCANWETKILLLSQHHIRKNQIWACNLKLKVNNGPILFQNCPIIGAKTANNESHTVSIEPMLKNRAFGLNISINSRGLVHFFPTNTCHFEFKYVASGLIVQLDCKKKEQSVLEPCNAKTAFTETHITLLLILNVERYEETLRKLLAVSNFLDLIQQVQKGIIRQIIHDRGRYIITDLNNFGDITAIDETLKAFDMINLCDVQEQNNKINNLRALMTDNITQSNIELRRQIEYIKRVVIPILLESKKFKESAHLLGKILKNKEEAKRWGTPFLIPFNKSYEQVKQERAQQLQGLVLNNVVSFKTEFKDICDTIYLQRDEYDYLNRVLKYTN
jgi:hypothetical protein